MMPAEFAMACYRLHTMVRNNYTIRRGTRIGIFNTTPLNLVGGRPVPPELVQQSDLFFRMPTSPAFDGPNITLGELLRRLSKPAYHEGTWMCARQYQSAVVQPARVCVAQ